MKLIVKPIIRIAPHSYTLLFNEHLTADEEKVGTINRRTQVIEIDSNLAPTQKEVTFWHEVFHELDHHFSLRINDDVVENLAVGITQFLQENFDIELDFSEIPIKTTP